MYDVTGDIKQRYNDYNLNVWVLQTLFTASSIEWFCDFPVYELA